MALWADVTVLAGLIARDVDIRERQDRAKPSRQMYAV